MTKKILEMKNINKSFSKTKVLKNVDFELNTGEVHALLGSNGAGKSTLMKILTGVYDYDSGEINIEGVIVDNNRVDSRKHGISMIFQELSLVPSLTVWENIFLGDEITKNYQLDKREMKERSKKILETLGINIDPDISVSKLSTGMRQMVEIAKAISKKSKILVFDEPTTALSDNETNQLFKIINDLKQQNISIVYISHRMNEILQISDKLTILRDGQKILTESVSNLTMKKIITHMISEKASGDNFSWKKRDYDTRGRDILRVENLSINKKIKNINFSVKEGEILGIAGLMGSGRTEILEALFGIKHFENGEIFVNDQKVKINNVQDAIAAGFALIPEDRRVQGLVLEHSLKENIVLPILNKLSDKLNHLSEKEITKVAKNSAEKINVKFNNMNAAVKLLSGGNQQKVVISKWLNSNPKILMLDEPTAGVDIGAKSEIVEIIRSVANEGNGAIVVSSELTELLALCDRILVLFDGEIIQTLNRESIKSEEDLQHAIQSKG